MSDAVNQPQNGTNGAGHLYGDEGRDRLFGHDGDDALKLSVGAFAQFQSVEIFRGSFGSGKTTIRFADAAKRANFAFRLDDAVTLAKSDFVL